MAKATIIIKDEKDGGVNMKVVFSPSIKRGQKLTNAQAFAWELQRTLGGPISEAIEKGFPTEKPDELK